MNCHCKYCNRHVNNECNLSEKGCQTDMYECFDGKTVRYKQANIHSEYGGSVKGLKLQGKIKEVFKSQDGTFDCFWIENESALITELQLL